ncbi:MAG TPA: YfcE family phosphodiesterase, partial [Piscirickettsiaceae bacterium]|nr:YfcE family phosphodiesterase [Piscirickettsiaceae bacterium]
MIKKIGILSDTHGVVHPGVVEVINQCDIAIHAGD